MPRKKRRGRNRRPKATKEAPKADSPVKPPAPPTPPASGSSPAQNVSPPAAAKHDADMKAIHDRTAALATQHSDPPKATQDVSASKPSASDPVSSGDKESKGSHDAAMQAIHERTLVLANKSAVSKDGQDASTSEPSVAKPEPAADKKERRRSQEGPAELYQVTLGLTDEQLKAAQEKFDELDEDESGTLKGPEMHKLADWITSALGQGDSTTDQHKRRKDRYGRSLMKKLDSDGDGELSFDEFVGWYAETSKQIKELHDTQALTTQFEQETEASSEAESKSEDVDGAKKDPYAAVSEFWEVHQKKHSELVEQGQNNLKKLKAKIEARTIARIQLLQKESEEVLGAARDHLARVQKTKADGDTSEVLDNAEKFYMSQITEVAELLEKLGAKIGRIEQGEWLRGAGNTAPGPLESERL